MPGLPTKAKRIIVTVPRAYCGLIPCHGKTPSPIDEQILNLDGEKHILAVPHIAPVIYRAKRGSDVGGWRPEPITGLRTLRAALCEDYIADKSSATASKRRGRYAEYVHSFASWPGVAPEKANAIVPMISSIRTMISVKPCSRPLSLKRKVSFSSVLSPPPRKIYNMIFSICKLNLDTFFKSFIMY